MACAGEDREIILGFEYGNPFVVQCRDPPPTGPPLRSCSSLLEQLPASSIEQSFGPRGADVDVVLPRSFYGGNVACLINLLFGFKINHKA